MIVGPNRQESTKYKYPLAKQELGRIVLDWMLRLENLK